MTGPLGKQSGPHASTGHRQPPQTTTATIARRTAADELAAWGAAVIHLHSAGLPAAVPQFPAAWLARRGINADWTAAA